jgi:hypothetical protein
VVDDESGNDPWQRMERTWLRVLQLAAADGAPGVSLLLEDDLDFNRHLRRNLERWAPLGAADGRTPFFASLYYCFQTALWRSTADRYLMAAPETVWGSQALLLSRATARHILRHWHEGDAVHDVRMAQLAGRVGPIYYHVPSLTQHLDVPSTWGSPGHRAPDFDPEWLAP